MTEVNDPPKGAIPNGDGAAPLLKLRGIDKHFGPVQALYGVDLDLPAGYSGGALVEMGGRIVGYAGLWKMSDEAHITTVGVRSGQQGKGYGHALMAALIQRAYQLGSRWLTLEVRPSNDIAVRLYEKFGFNKEEGELNPARNSHDGRAGA